MYLYEKIAKEKERQAMIDAMDVPDITTEDAYTDEHFIAMMCSSSHTYGNALAFIQNYIIKFYNSNI